MEQANLHGIIPVFKPKGISSHQLINQLRRITGIRKIGHGGTLDPLASGVMVVAIGRENTRKIDKEVKKEKEYETVIKLGMDSTTDDEEGQKTEYQIENPPTLFQVKTVIKKFIGEIEQIPPIYSAVKINGQEAYKLARKGKIPEMKSRLVLINNIKILNYQYPLLSIKVICGPGVYIRSLARDIGKALGTGAYMAELVRTRVGEYKLEDCLQLDYLINPPKTEETTDKSKLKSKAQPKLSTVKPTTK